MEIEGVPFFFMNIRGYVNPIKDVRVSRDLARLAVDEDVHIIHAHGFKAGLLCFWSKMNRKRRYSILCTFHNPLRRSPSVFRDFLNRWMITFVGWCVDHVVTVSGEIHTQALELLGVPEGKVTCINNGIDLSNFFNFEESGNFRRGLGVTEKMLLVGAVARLIPQKGIQYFIKAISELKAEFPDVRFVVIGDGPYRIHLEEKARSAGLSGYLYFAGFRSDIPQVLSDLDIFVLPTLEEGFPVSVIEAMAAGKPVVASAVGGLLELVTDDTGILIPPGNSKQLRKALSVLLTNPSLGRKMGITGRQRVEKYFSVQTMAGKYAGLYERMVDENTLKR